MDADDAARLALSVARLSRRLRPAGAGLSHGLLSALASVSKHGPLRLAEIAQHELLSAPSTTRLVTELESRGLVRRESDPADGRAFLINTTAAGLETIQQARSERVALLSEWLDLLEPADARAIRSALPALERLTEEIRVPVD